MSDPTIVEELREVMVDSNTGNAITNLINYISGDLKDINDVTRRICTFCKENKTDPPFTEINAVQDNEVYTCLLYDSCVTYLDEDTDEYNMELGDSIDKTRLVHNPTFRDGVAIWEGCNSVALALSYLEKGTRESTKREFKKWLRTPPVNLTRYKLTSPDAKPPVKKGKVESGFDLTLVKHLRDEGDVSFYTTNLVLLPPPKVWYEIVLRSSFGKKGFNLANGTGVIDGTYRGEIIVGLYKRHSGVKDLELPAVCVQAIPRWDPYMEMREVTEVTETSRGDSGGFGSGQFK